MKSKSKVIVASMLSLFFLSPGSLFSQWKKGDWLAEGSIGNLQFTTGQLMAGSFKNKNNATQISFNLHPSLGYFLTEQLAVVGTFGFNFTNSKSYVFYSDDKAANKSIYQFSSVSLLPGVRYYFKTQSVKNKFYVQVNGGAGISFTTKNINTSYDLSGNITSEYKVTYPKTPVTFYGQAFIGFNHFITTNIALNSSLGYNYGKSKNDILVTTTSINGSYSNVQTQTSNSINLFWSLGFTLIIPGKKDK